MNLVTYLFPYDAGDSRWFSEGLASYYQNITQARIGMFNEQTMWQKLYDGFERGNKQQNYRHQTLDYVSDNIAHKPQLYAHLLERSFVLVTSRYCPKKTILKIPISLTHLILHLKAATIMLL